MSAVTTEKESVAALLWRLWRAPAAWSITDIFAILVVASLPWSTTLASLFDSHLFDFNEGWMYVLGVGIAGGMALGTAAREAAVGTSAEP